MHGFTVVLALVTAAAVCWLLTSGVWWLLRRFGRVTGLDEKADRAFDAEGELDAADYLKFREQHPHGGGH